jgi:hypothetical protein
MMKTLILAWVASFFIGATIGTLVVTLIPIPEPTVSVVQITESYGFLPAQDLTEKQLWNCVKNKKLFLKHERITATDEESCLILFGMDTK